MQCSRHESFPQCLSACLHSRIGTLAEFVMQKKKSQTYLLLQKRPLFYYSHCLDSGPANLVFKIIKKKNIQPADL